MAENTKLFKPLKVGSIQLDNRVVMAPLTRFRADFDHVPTDAMAQYYAQRAVVPGTLLISEATYITAKAGGYPTIPGLWTDAQLAGWKKVTDAVHAKGSKIICQLWYLGRAARPDPVGSGGAFADDDFDYKNDFVSASDVKMWEGGPTPRALTEEEIWATINDYATAAKNAVEKGGFDGVEIHGAHGYLIDQFTQDTCNKRTDQWGGSIENRARFALEVTKAVVKAVGADRTGIRLSPWAQFQGMRMKDPIPQFSYLIHQLRELDLSFLHLVEPRVSGVVDRDPENESLDFALQSWGREKPVFIAGGFTTETAIEAVESKYHDHEVAVVFGRRFISTPDLVYRVKKGIPFNEYDRFTFYINQKEGAKREPGYVDYPYSEEFIKEFGKPDVAV
ncbi:NADH:flavin oxidoreductase/NADH oxidase family protein [Cryphonectria parasitica EP155]|uniref:NADH:flavin oxidoreductase/NADH oxidase family protein n=1 Tax=Cryphonectria parasitica (strain ATCC 38755 / EP155) TaxID=660469 RepID=A0A9P4XW15_CRYP1|nr:NADH:flavin oxidoreductase/NADH oxidase family protein [Cryphonectria parasitica EP155]KAF3761999.1 NADH:flavin oxidoreductase/NADH oxidase family protein [Cryphonectria parasitica EP155]